MLKLPIAQKKKPPAVVYLSRSKLGIYCPTGLFFKEIGPEIINHLDVVKAPEFEKLVKELIESNKIEPTTFLMVVANDVCFEKDFTGEACETQRTEIDKYIETVPFDFIRWKSFRVGKDCKVVAINREFYELVSSTMEKMGFTLEAVVPQSLAGVPMDAGLDDAVAKQLVARIETLRTTVSLFESYTFTSEKKKEEELTSQKRTPVLLIVFLVMIAVLVVLVIVTKPFGEPPKRKAVPTENPPEFQSQQPAVPNVAPGMAPTSDLVSPTPVATASALSNLSLKTQIINGSRIAGQAETVRKALITLGLKDFQVSNSTTENKGKTSVVFAPSVVAQDRTRIISALTPIFGQVFAQEGELKQFDVVITTGQASVVVPTATP